MNYVKKALLRSPITRCSSTVATEFVNRNPRNLERMRIARKPDGYHLENPGRGYWHKLILTSTNRTFRAEVVHFINGPVIEAKTSDWAIRKQLYSTKDTCAFINLGRVFAQRCLESGINEIFCDVKPAKGGKVEKFLREVKSGGILLKEPQRYVKPNPWDKHRPEKPWEVAAE